MHKGRIIFGQLKRRIIELPSVQSTRPTTDAVKESMFNCLVHRFSLNFSEWSVIDLFAGSGALGFESASLGSTEVIFCEVNHQACEIIKKNVANLCLSGIAKIFRNDVRKLKFGNFKNNKLLIFFDPPYEDKQLLDDQINKFIINMNNFNISNMLLVIETPHPELLNKYKPHHILNVSNKSIVFILL